MISLRNLNKYYNKGKSNEIHVINNTSIDFPKTGLVALTGPSGCGKTTLLNVIGGLDSFHSGEIVFNEKVIKRYNPLNWDILRNEKVGYIFQNYNLVLSRTVYENIELALNMAGLYEKKKVEERVNYVLESVGMYNYRKRNVRALSGGQQQRVAIARALAKDPDVVLADEPTGNLDANNTFEIMSIIKKISETRLVILVTHERGLVDFYADRIIEIADGKVIRDFENAGGAGFDHVDERNIYLKDLNLDEKMKDSGIEYYYETERDESLNVKLIEIKGNLYVKVNSKRKIKYIDDDSEIRLIDDHYKKREVKDVSDYDFDLSQFEKLDHSKIKKSFIRWSTSIKNGFKRVFSKKKFVSKLFIFGYFIVSALIVFQLASFGNLTSFDDKEFLQSPRELMKLDLKIDINSNDIREILAEIDGIEISPYFSTVAANFNIDNYYQGKANESAYVYPVKLSYYDDVQVLHGEMPDEFYEIAIDEWIAETLIEKKGFADISITKIEDLIGAFVSSYSYYEGVQKFKVVGIVKTESPIIIVPDESIYGFYNNNYFDSVLTYGSMKERINIVEGRGLLSDNEILIYDGESSYYELGQTYELWGLGTKTIVGFYEAANNEYAYKGYFPIVTNSSYASAIINNISDAVRYYNFSGIMFYVDDEAQAIEDFEDLGYTLYNSYEVDKIAYQERMSEINAAKIAQVVVIIVGIIVYIFFMMRTSVLNRIREIGVYRAIGATKRDMYKVFFSEIITFTIVAAVPSYLLMSYIVIELQKGIDAYLKVFNLPFHLFIAGISGIFALNIIFGMLPIFTLLRKTPAEIITKYDI